MAIFSSYFLENFEEFGVFIARGYIARAPDRVQLFLAITIITASFKCGVLHSLQDTFYTPSDSHLTLKR